MKKLIKDCDGVTLIETVVATAIIGIILISVVGALIFAQKMIVFNDGKNNVAGKAQEVTDEIVNLLSTGNSITDVVGKIGEEALYVAESDFLEIEEIRESDSDQVKNEKMVQNKKKSKQYRIVECYDSKLSDKVVGYNVYVRYYFESTNSPVNLTAFARKKSGKI